MKKLIMVFSIVFITLGMMGCGKSDETLILGQWTNENQDVIEFFEDNTCTVEAIFPESYGSSKYIILKDGRIKITSIYNDVETFDYSVKKDELVINGESFFRELKNKEEKESKEDTNRKVENTNKEEENLEILDEASSKWIAWAALELMSDEKLSGNFEGEVSEENTSKEISAIIDKIIESGEEVPYIKSEKFKKESKYFYIKVDEDFNIKVSAGKNGTCIYPDTFQ